MLPVLYEDNHLLVVNKPPELATMGAPGKSTAHSLAASFLREKYNKPGRAFVGVVSRLDAMTSGVLVFAKTSKAASRLTPQFSASTAKQADQGKSATKIYLAVVEGQIHASSGTLENYVKKNDAARRMVTTSAVDPEAKLARLEFQTLHRSKQHSTVAVQLITGRKHQIRLQFSEIGNPVLGDRKYDSHRAFGRGIALHSWQLRIEHPTLKQSMWFQAPTPDSWKKYTASIGSLDDRVTQLRECFETNGQDS